MKRIMLFIATNLAIMVVLSISLRLLGFEAILDQQGAGLDINSLVIFATVFGFGGALISLFISKWSALKMTGATIITSPANRHEAWLLETVRQQADAAGVGMPDVAIYPGSEMNAFATGWNRNSALVAVSEGLLQQMQQDEVEAVLAHEISHVANGDMVTMALMQGVVNTFVIFFARVIGHLVDRVILKNERGHGPGFWIATMVAEMVLGLLASLLIFWFSRQREFRADAGAATLAGKRKMIAALTRLGQGETTELPDQLAAFGIAGGRSFSDLFRTHPTLQERIQRLSAG
ncbi:MAG: protease HtpX [Gammaproteobacteria bacterium]|nr:protease HtpX [Gammaproteobacteria bacterium]